MTYLVATHLGVRFAAVTFGVSIVVTAAATLVGIRRRRRRKR